MLDLVLVLVLAREWVRDLVLVLAWDLDLVLAWDRDLARWLLT